MSFLQEEWCSEAGTSPSASRATGGKKVVVRAVVGGTLGHAAVDTLFYTSVAAATALGWTWVAPLAATHVVLDVFVWGFALRPVAQHLMTKPRGTSAPEHGNLAEPSRI